MGGGLARESPPGRDAVACTAPLRGTVQLGAPARDLGSRSSGRTATSWDIPGVMLPGGTNQPISNSSPSGSAP
jgi:hypothetical protein